MGANVSDLPGGLLFAERCRFANVAAVGVGSTDSDYTEATPGPGLASPNDPITALRVEVSGAQVADVDIRVVKAGGPGREGAQVAYKLASEAATSYRGWDGPQLLTGWIPIEYDTVIDRFASFDCAVVPSTQRMVIVRKDGNDDTAAFRVFNEDHSVTVPIATAAAGDDWNHPSVVVLPGLDRILMFHGGTAYYTDDLGLTLSTWAEDIYPSSAGFGRTSSSVYRDNIVMFVEDDSGNGDVWQLASSDLGASFVLVGQFLGTGTSFDVVSNDDGIHVVYLEGGLEVRYRKLSSAFEPLDLIEATVVRDLPVSTSCTIATDGGGALYCVTTQNTSTRIYTSLDTGETWDQYKSPSVSLGEAGYSLFRLRGRWAFGQLLLAHNWQADVAMYDDSLAVAVLGGWSSNPLIQTNGQGSAAKYRRGFSGLANAATPSIVFGAGRSWLPIEAPEDIGWTLTGPGGTLEFPGRLAMATFGAQQTRYHRATIDSTSALLVMADFEPVSGGSLTTNDIGLDLRLADGTEDVNVLFNATPTGYRIRDVHGAADLATVTTAGRYQLMVRLTGPGDLLVLRRLIGSTVWVVDFDGTTTLNGAPITGGYVRWGQPAVGTGTSRWTLLSFAEWADADGLELSQDVVTHLGYPLTPRTESAPVIGGTNIAAGYLALTAGPARKDDGVSVPAFHAHAVANAHSDVSPAPSRRWRSTSTDEQRIVYDLGAVGWVGDAIALYAGRCNFRQAIVERWNGAVWITVGTLDLSTGFAGLDYQRVGSAVIPDQATTPDGARFLWEQELRGGWIRTTAGSSRINAQRAGGWTQALTVPPVLELSDPAALLTSGTCSLVSHSGVAVFYPGFFDTAQFWSVRIPAGTAGIDTPDGEEYYEAGTLSLCRAQPYGARVSWGRTNEKRLNVRTDVDTSGTARVRGLGEHPRVWTMGWSDPTTHKALRAGPDVDYIGPARPLAAAEDVEHMLSGLIDVLDGGALPVVAIEEFPAATETITDPSRFLYGRLVSSMRASNINGDLGVDEMQTIDSLRIEELI